MLQKKYLAGTIFELKKCVSIVTKFKLRVMEGETIDDTNGSSKIYSNWKALLIMGTWFGFPMFFTGIF